MYKLWLYSKEVDLKIFVENCTRSIISISKHNSETENKQRQNTYSSEK